MPPKPDITTRQHIELLVDRFYAKVQKDLLIGPFFNEVAKVNWEEHIPTLCDFWESVLLQGNAYKGNAMAVHQQLNQKKALKPEHFERWTKLFLETVDEHFSGNKAELAKQRALSIATVIQIKIGG